MVEFESFPFEVLQIFGDYIYRVGRTLTVLELVQFFEFCHFLGLERVCKDIVFELCRVIEKKYNTCEVSLEVRGHRSLELTVHKSTICVRNTKQK